MYVGNRSVAASSYLIFPDGTAQEVWRGRAQHILIFLENLEKQTDLLMEVLRASDVYFQDYRASNELNEAFYR